MEIVGYTLAIGIGISLGLLGGGGSVLALPVLVYVMGIEPKTAIAMTLVIVGTVSLLGVIPHARKGNLDLPKAAIFGTATMVGAYLGARLAGLPFVTSSLQMLIFAGAMLLAAGLMIYRTSRSPREELSPQPAEDLLDSPQYTKPLCRFCWLWLLTEGMGVGVLTGLVGVGGGFAIVPALVLLAKVPMRKAIGTSLLIIAANAIAGFVGYLGAVEFNWPLTVTFTFLAGIGTVLGSYGSRYVSVVHLQKSFGYFLLAVAALVLVQQYGRAESRPQPNRQGNGPGHSAPLFRLS